MPYLPNGAKAPVKKKQVMKKMAKKPSLSPSSGAKPTVGAKKPIAKPIHKMKKKPSIKGAKALPGYKVPAKLLKKSASTMRDAPVREGQKLTAAEKKAYKAGTAKLTAQARAALKAPPKKKQGIKKPVSDWDKGMGVAKNISIANTLAKRSRVR